MKTRECIEKLRTAKWIRIMALAIVAFIVFSYLHSRGISPVWAAVAIVHSQLSGFLKIQTYEADIPYRSKYHLAEQGCPFGRLFLFPMPYGNENDEDTHGKDREAHTAIDRP